MLICTRYPFVFILGLYDWGILLASLEKSASWVLFVFFCFLFALYARKNQYPRYVSTGFVVVVCVVTVV